MERCPNCRARDPGGEHCRRCGMELAQLWALEQAAEALLQRAIGHLAAGEWRQARQELERAQGLARRPLQDALLGLLGTTGEDRPVRQGEEGGY